MPENDVLNHVVVLTNWEIRHNPPWVFENAQRRMDTAITEAGRVRVGDITWTDSDGPEEGTTRRHYRAKTVSK